MGRMTTLLDFLRTRLGRCLFLLLSLHVSAASLADQPNILLIYVDDLGFGDLGSYGHPVIRTPNIDGLAREGMTFTNYYAPSALCSPSRAAVLTGRTPYRTGIKSWIPEDSGVFLRGEEITLAEVLKDEGYATALVGKWHLNSDLASDDEPQPTDQGFDYFYGHNAFQVPTNRNPANVYRDRELLPPQEGFTAQLYVDEAIGEPLIGLLEDRRSDVLIAAAGALGELGDPRAVEPLVASLADNHAHARASAAGALGELGERLAVDLERFDNGVGPLANAANQSHPTTTARLPKMYLWPSTDPKRRARLMLSLIMTL